MLMSFSFLQLTERLERMTRHAGLREEDVEAPHQAAAAKAVIAALRAVPTGQAALTAAAPDPARASGAGAASALREPL